MKLKIGKTWTKIPCDNVCTLFVGQDISIFIETTTMDAPPETEGVLYRETTIPIATDKFIYCKLPESSVQDEVEVDYVNFISVLPQ